MGEFDLNGIPPMPRGVPQIEVTYDINANGILEVSAAEKSTGKSNKIAITNDKSRSKEDIERMVSEAAKYEAEDKAVMERVEAKNGCEAYLYNARNSIREEKVKSQLGEEDIDAVEKVVTEGLEWLDQNSSAAAEEIKEKQKGWEDTIRPILMKLYASASGEASASDQPSDQPSEPKVDEVD
jgi:L1 cell adhesion molecule like protein